MQNCKWKSQYSWRVECGRKEQTWQLSCELTESAGGNTDKKGTPKLRKNPFFGYFPKSSLPYT